MAAMFCSSLRLRPTWAEAVAMLRQHTKPQFSETKLATHDIAMPLQDEADRDRVYRFVLISSLEVGGSETEERLERLYYLDGGKNAAVVLLLKDEGGKNAMETFGKLEVLASDKFNMPIIPLDAGGELITTLQHFTAARADARKASSLTFNIVRELLPYCTTQKRLSERAVYFLSDISTSFRGLVDIVATGEGREMVETLLGQEDAAGVFRFFAE